MVNNVMTMGHDSRVYHDMMRVVEGHHYDPHQLLGLHDLPQGDRIIRLWRPGAEHVYLELKGEVVEAQRVHEAGFFELRVPGSTEALDYKVYHTSGQLSYDPYAFLPTVGEMDQYLFNQGVHYQLYHVLGGRLAEHQGVLGVKFAVWAPSASTVSLVGDFNHWDGRTNPMRSLGVSGLWELFVPGLQEGEKYKFEILTQQGDRLVKADPYAYSSELRPATASVVADVDRFHWEDDEWMQRRTAEVNQQKPMNIYEVHLGSWRRDHGQFLNYRTLAHQLADYCLDMGYTHVELLPVAEHPLDQSWGYQVTGFYAVTSRFGSPEDFQYFVNHMHKAGIGVLVDWVPGHFPTDAFSLARFDGTHLYEHCDPRQGFHPHWSTNIFNFGRTEVANFLIANALFWLDVMHIDGLRVDAVASMLYLDYGREQGQWIPNCYGGKENLEAIEFIKHMNSVVHQRYPGVLTIAEESTSFSGVSRPVEQGGLGFDLKWNMGWMNDTLRYFSKDSIYRHYHHNDLTFGLLYAFSERFISVFSHDEVVHGKGSLLSKMPGDYWQQFANLRLLLSYQMCQPGKKLLFMGAELGQWNEWSADSQIEWELLQFPIHDGLHQMVKELNHFYLNEPALWQQDFHHEGFEWVDLHDRQNSVVAYLRKGYDRILLCVHNCTPTYHENYYLHHQNVRSLREVFTSDDARFGGSDKHNPHPEIVHNEHGHAVGVRLHLAPLATMIFEIEHHF